MCIKNRDVPRSKMTGSKHELKNHDHCLPVYKTGRALFTAISDIVGLLVYKAKQNIHLIYGSISEALN